MKREALLPLINERSADVTLRLNTGAPPRTGLSVVDVGEIYIWFRTGTVGTPDRLELRHIHSATYIENIRREISE